MATLECGACVLTVNTGSAAILSLEVQGHDVIPHPERGGPASAHFVLFPYSN
ncbi:hypothetical protein KIPB_014472, partial [Kipferlia bialata]|eukprot:g14472.t1